MVSIAQRDKEQVFKAKQEIARTFYSPNKHQQRAIINNQIREQSPALSKYAYGSPNRGAQNILNLNTPGTDFMSKFGNGGGGAPMRDNQGNILALRRPGQEIATALSQDQIKQLQKDQYQKELLEQINEKKLAKEQQKARQIKDDLDQEMKIKQELDELNKREQFQISKERGVKPQEQRFNKINEAQQQIPAKKNLRPISHNQMQSRLTPTPTPDQVVKNYQIPNGNSQPEQLPIQKRFHQYSASTSFSDAFVALLSKERQVDKAHQEMRRIQEKLQNQLELLKTEARDMKAQNQQIAQDMQKMIEESAARRNRQNHQFRTEDTYQNDNLYSERMSPARGNFRQLHNRVPIQFPIAKPEFQQAAQSILRRPIQSARQSELVTEQEPFQLKVLSSRVPVIKSYFQQSQIPMLEPTNIHEQSFVNEFLKEINDIHDMNQRSKESIQGHTNQTNIKQYNQFVNFSDIVPQKKSEHTTIPDISLHKQKSEQNQAPSLKIKKNESVKNSTGNNLESQIDAIVLQNPTHHFHTIDHDHSDKLNDSPFKQKDVKTTQDSPTVDTQNNVSISHKILEDQKGPTASHLKQHEEIIEEKQNYQYFTPDRNNNLNKNLVYQIPDDQDMADLSFRPHAIQLDDSKHHVNQLTEDGVKQFQISLQEPVIQQDEIFVTSRSGESFQGTEIDKEKIEQENEPKTVVNKNETPVQTVVPLKQEFSWLDHQKEPVIIKNNFPVQIIQLNKQDSKQNDERPQQDIVINNQTPKKVETHQQEIKNNLQKQETQKKLEQPQKEKDNWISDNYGDSPQVVEKIPEVINKELNITSEHFNNSHKPDAEQSQIFQTEKAPIHESTKDNRISTAEHFRRAHLPDVVETVQIEQANKDKPQVQEPIKVVEERISTAELFRRAKAD